MYPFAGKCKVTRGFVLSILVTNVLIVSKPNLIIGFNISSSNFLHLCTFKTPILYDVLKQKFSIEA
jgi:hypothetical protein